MFTFFCLSNVPILLFTFCTKTRKKMDYVVLVALLTCWSTPQQAVSLKFGKPLGSWGGVAFDGQGLFTFFFLLILFSQAMSSFQDTLPSSPPQSPASWLRRLCHVPLSRRYVKQEQIGKGTYGVVYRCWSHGRNPLLSPWPHFHFPFFVFVFLIALFGTSGKTNPKPQHSFRRCSLRSLP